MKIGVVGASGRMGRMIIQEVLVHSDECEIVGATAREGSYAIGRDVGKVAEIDPIGVTVTDDAAELFKAADAVIDFTSPEATVEHAKLAAEHATALVCGTTGLTRKQEESLGEAAKAAPVVYAANMSVGVNMLLSLVEQTAARLGVEFDIEIFEAHHRNKVDAPSGTALALGRAAAAGREVGLDSAAVYAREGHTGAREDGKIGFSVFRGGDVVGEHTVTFAGQGERVELVHKASDRRIFATGAVRAATWTKGKSPGVYTMKDVLDL